MSDRIQNIVINYKYNTTEIERGAASVNRAQQVTDRLQQSTQAFTRSAQQGYRATGTSITAMQNDLARLKTQIETTSSSDKKRLSELSAQYKKLAADLKNANDQYLKLNQTTKETARNTKELASQFGSVVSAVKLFIAAGAAREVVNINLEMARLAGNVEGVSRAFQRQIPNAEGLLTRLRAATQGTVTDLDLMQKTLQAKNFGIDVQRLPELLEFAAVRAQQTGVEVDYLVNSIVSGIGRKSILILDNLGISATRLKEEFGGASLQSQSLGEVTAAVARIAKQELDKMGGSVTTAKTQVDQLTVSWHELRVEAAKMFTDGEQGGLVGQLKEYVDSFKTLIEAKNRGISVEELYQEKYEKQQALYIANGWMERAFTKDKKENIKLLEQEIALITKSLGQDAKELEIERDQIKFLYESIEAGKGNAYQIQENIDRSKIWIEQKNQEVRIDQETLKLLQAKYKELTNINFVETENLGIVEAKRKEIESLNEALEKATSKEQIIKIRFQIDQAQGELNELLQGDPVKDKATGKTTFRIFDDKITEMPDKLSPSQKQDLNTFAQEAFKQLEESIKNLGGIQFQFSSPGTPGVTSQWSIIREEFKKMQLEFADFGIDATATMLDAQVEAELNAIQMRIEANRAYYDEVSALAGDNDRVKQELAIKRDREEQQLRRKQFEAEKDAAKKRAIIDGAAALVKAWVNPGYPGAIPLSVLIAANTAVQIAAINKATPKFKDGVIDLKGPGTKTSDSIPAMLSRGESVMTAFETESSKGIFKAIRAKKLNDKVLKDIVNGRSGGAAISQFDDSRLLRKLDELKNSQPSFESVGSTLIHVEKKQERLRKVIKGKSITK